MVIRRDASELFLESVQTRANRGRKEIEEFGRRYTCQHVGLSEKPSTTCPRHDKYPAGSSGTFSVQAALLHIWRCRHEYNPLPSSFKPPPVSTNSPRLCHCYLLNSPFRSFPLSCPSSLPRDKLSSCFARGTTLVCLGVARPSRSLSLSRSSCYRTSSSTLYPPCS